MSNIASVHWPDGLCKAAKITHAILVANAKGGPQLLPSAPRVDQETCRRVVPDCTDVPINHGEP